MNDCEQTDAELLAAVKAGDRAAFRALYERFSPLVFTLCERILHNHDEAEDATADIFWEVWRRRDRYDASRGTPRTYLMTLGRSRAIDRLRSHASRPDRARQRPDGARLEPSAEASPPDAASDRELYVRISTALAELNERQREAMELAYYQGLSHQEIADRLSAPLGTVKTHIRQGLTRIRSALGIPTQPR